MRKQIVREWIGIVIGLLVFSFGVHLTIRANIGLAPWDCFGMGLSFRFPVTYGQAMTAMSVLILIIDLVMRERIGFGTIIDAFCTGNFIQLFNDIDPLPFADTYVKAPGFSVLIGVTYLVTGLFIMAFGQFLYMRQGQGCGPRDALIIGTGKRLPEVPIGAVEVAVWLLALSCGFLLGGPVGIGTVISTLGGGIAMQLVFRLVRFEPRRIHSKDVAEVVKLLAGNKCMNNE